MNKGKILLGFLILFIFIAKFSFGSIQGSQHDFSNANWNTSGEICRPCHTPHNASDDLPDIPLWNHTTTSSTFILYSSDTLEETPEQPRGISKSCLSCHDGTIALDSFGGNTGGTPMTGEALIGTDLSHEHPISITWSHQGVTGNCGTCHDAHGGAIVSGEVQFFDGYVECASCHDVHNGMNLPKLLRKTMNQSALCFQCHQK